MKNTLCKELDKLNEAEFKELELALEVAKGAKNLMREFGISADDLMVNLRHLPIEASCYLSGSFPYTLCDIASQQALYVKLKTAAAAAEKAAKKVTPKQ